MKCYFINSNVVCYFYHEKPNLKSHGCLICEPPQIIMDNVGIRNLKDFLLQYNKISESCFLSCVNHLSDRSLSQDECGCVDMCTKKHVNVNHKVMQVYLEIQPLLINKRIDEMNKQQTALEEKQKKELEENQQSGISAGAQKPEVKDVQEAKKLVDISPGNEHIAAKGVVKAEGL